jgi:nucleotide-binding universal stress UspA family protein
MPYRHVLVMCDGSSEADEAVRAASEIALADHARLTVAAVVEFEQPGRGCGAWSRTWNDVLRDAAQADLARAAKVVESPAHFTVLSGAPETALADGARELGCDAIMLPSRTRLARILSRDRASVLRRRTSCAVLQPR